MTEEIKIKQEQCFPFDAILGHTKGALVTYFGLPLKDYGELCVFAQGHGILATIFRSGKASAYALYSNEGRLIHCKGVEPLLEEPVVDSMDTATFVGKYGEPQFDVGSGLSIPSYLGANCYLYALSTDGDTIRRVRKFSLPMPPRE